jgi:Domain of unknown function (DUF6430)
MLIFPTLVGFWRSKSNTHIKRTFGRPDVTIEIKIGDLFNEPSHLIIGFNDVFDTDYTDDEVISHSSVQGQFQDRIYQGELNRLDSDIRVALTGIRVEHIESREEKRDGKLERYPVGTVAVLGNSRQRFFCAAYGKMRNDLTIRSSTDDIWFSLGQIWEAVDIYGQRKEVAIPIIGSEMARLNHLDRETLTRIILLSFIARARKDLICKKLTVVIHPKDAHHINLLEMEAFLHSL